MCSTKPVVADMIGIDLDTVMEGKFYPPARSDNLLFFLQFSYLLYLPVTNVMARVAAIGAISICN